MEEAKKRKDIVSVGYISFAGTKALEYIYGGPGVKTRRILFNIDRYLFEIVYEAINNFTFGKFSSDVDEGLKNFKPVF